jgi:hypothetical protein
MMNEQFKPDYNDIKFSDDLLPWGDNAISANLFLSTLLRFKRGEFSEHSAANELEYIERILNIDMNHLKDFNAEEIQNFALKMIPKYHKFVIEQLKGSLTEVLNYNDPYITEYSETNGSRKQPCVKEEKKDAILNWLFIQLGGTTDNPIAEFFRTSEEFMFAPSDKENWNLSQIKDRFNQDRPNKRYLLQGASLCVKNNTTPPEWVYRELFEAIYKMLTKGYSFEEALGFVSKDLAVGIRQRALASMVKEAHESGLTQHEATDLVRYDAYYFFKWIDDKKKGNSKAKKADKEFYTQETLLSYFHRHKKDLSGTSYYRKFFLSLFTIPECDVEELQSAFYIEEWRKTTHKSRLEYYEENIGKEDSEIVQGAYEITKNILEQKMHKYIKN